VCGDSADVDPGDLSASGGDVDDCEWVANS
jgi:hypothetical protein